MDTRADWLHEMEFGKDDDERIKESFSPPLNDEQLARWKADRCIICGVYVEDFCDEVPHCNACDERVVAQMEEVYEC